MLGCPGIWISWGEELCWVLFWEARTMCGWTRDSSGRNVDRQTRKLQYSLSGPDAQPWEKPREQSSGFGFGAMNEETEFFLCSGKQDFGFSCKQIECIRDTHFRFQFLLLPEMIYKCPILWVGAQAKWSTLLHAFKCTRPSTGVGNIFARMLKKLQCLPCTVPECWHARKIQPGWGVHGRTHSILI